jgi:hypothetical protein
MLYLNLLLSGSNSVIWVFDLVKSRKNFAKMIIAHEYPFNCVSHHFLKVFVSDLQPYFKMLSKNTDKLDCISIYEEEMFSLYELFGKLDCRFSFINDLWTNKNKNIGFMTLTCHYIDNSWNLKKRIINFTLLSSPHTGLNIAQAIHDKLVLWNLDKKVFILYWITPLPMMLALKHYSIHLIKNELPANDCIFHQRCGCHILNLIVQDGLGVLWRR